MPGSDIPCAVSSAQIWTCVTGSNLNGGTEDPPSLSPLILVPTITSLSNLGPHLSYISNTTTDTIGRFNLEVQMFLMMRNTNKS